MSCTLYFIWGPCAACHGMALVSHWRFHDYLRMNISADVLQFKINNNHVQMFLFKPVLGGGVDDSLHLPLPSMNRLNQSGPANICYFVVLGFFWGGSFFCILKTKRFNHQFLLYKYCHRCQKKVSRTFIYYKKY